MSRTAYRPAGHACDVECGQARGPVSACTCACGGVNHGVLVPSVERIAAARAAVSARGAFSNLPVVDDEEW